MYTLGASDVKKVDSLLLGGFSFLFILDYKWDREVSLV